MRRSLEELEAQKRDHEQELEKLSVQGRKLDEKILAAKVCSGVGALLFLSSLLGKTESGLGAVALVAAIIGAIWWWNLKRKADDLSRRSLTLREALISVEDQYYEP